MAYISGKKIAFSSNVNISTGGGDSGGGATSKEGDLNADFIWAKKVFEETNLEGYPYKMLELSFADCSSSTFEIRAGFKVLTSDGQFYENTTTSTIKIEHFWNDENAKNAEYYVGEKLRWIVQFATQLTNDIYVILKYNIIYLCSNGRTRIDFSSGSQMQGLITFDFVDGGHIYHSSTLSISGRALERIPSFTRQGTVKPAIDFNYTAITKLDWTPDLSTATTGNVKGLFRDCYKLRDPIYVDMRGYTNAERFYNNCKNLRTYIPLDLSDVMNFNYMFSYCLLLEEIDMYNTSKGTQFMSTFENCRSVKTIKNVDLINATSVTSTFSYCTNLTNLDIKNIKRSLTVGSGTSYGHLLTVDSLINAIKELHDNSTGTSTLTLTIGSANLTKLQNVYVKLIDTTDEMRAEDGYIDNKLPFVVCESTDEGAMHIIDEYAQLLKNWAIK